MTWTIASSPLDGGQCYGCDWATDLDEFIAVGFGSGDDVIATSPDASTWTGQTSPLDDGFGYGVVRAAALSLYVVVGEDTDGAGHIITSPDGATWTDRGNPFSTQSGVPFSVAVKPSTGALVAGCAFNSSTGHHQIAHSSNGTSWTAISTPFDSSGFPVQAIGYSATHDRWIAVGLGSQAAYSDNDGATWTAISPLPFTSPSAYNGVYYDATSDKWFVLGGDTSGNTIAVSTNNGSTWSMVDGSPVGSTAYAAIRVGSVLGLGGEGSHDLAVSSDGGATWAADATPDPFSSHANCFAYSPTLEFAIVGGSNSSSETIAYGVPSVPSSIPPGVSLALSDGPLTDPPTWTRIDDLVGVHVTGIEIDRGRPTERDKTQPGTVRITGYDKSGALDPTNDSSPLHPNILPVKQAAVTLWNPHNETWNWLFRGYVDTYSYTLDPSEKFMQFEITLVDMLDLLNDAEITPDQAGNTVPSESTGDVYYTGQHCDDRLLAVLADAGVDFSSGDFQAIWPTTLLQIASGNVFVQGRVYSHGTSLLQVIDEACDAEFPGATNRFITKTGAFAFRGRYYRFVPAFYAASSDADRSAGHELVHWDVGDSAAYTGDSTLAVYTGLKFEIGKTDLINIALVTPLGITDPQLASGSQYASDGTSIGKYGPRTSGMSLENLITGLADDGNNQLQETATFATATVHNYKDPVAFVNELVFKNPPEDGSPREQNTWAILAGLELSDLVSVTSTHPGGGGFSDEGHYVESIKYELAPLKGDVWNVTLTVGLSSQSHFSYTPASWNVPSIS